MSEYSIASHLVRGSVRAGLSLAGDQLLDVSIPVIEWPHQLLVCSC